MGSAASKGNASPTRVLVIGGEGAGKTLLLRQLANHAKRGKPEAIETTGTVPSIGTELMQMSMGRRTFVCREMGGSMIPVWPRFFAECSMVLFVVDSSSEAQLASATVELLTALHAPTLSGKPFALLFNKCDAAVQIPQSTLEEVMRVDDIVASQESLNRPTVCIRCSATTADGIVDICAWLVAQARIGAKPAQTSQLV